MKCFATLMLSLALLLGTAVPTQAARERTAEKVVVTAGRMEEKAKDVTQQVTVIDSTELAKGQYSQIGDILRNYGINVREYSTPGEGAASVSIRGLRSSPSGDSMLNPILFLIDGRPSGTGNINAIPMVSLERIEILRGPAAVQYGSSAVAGVVNIITRQGGEKTRAAVEFGIGSWETTKTEAGVSGMIGPVDFAGGVSWMTIGDDYQTGDGTTYFNTRVNHRTNYALNLGVNFLEEHRIGLSLIGTEADKMYNGNALYYNNEDTSGYTDRSNHSVDAKYTGGLKDYGLSWLLRYYNVEDEYTAVSLDTMSAGSQAWKTTGNTEGMQAQLAWKYGMVTLSGGFDWQDSDFKGGFDDYKTYLENYAGWLLGKISLLDETLVLSAGTRYDQYTLSHTREEGGEEDFDNLSWSLGAAYTPVEWLTFRANYGESFLVPTALSLIGYESNGTIVFGNADLDPEEGIGWDIGAEINWHSLNIGLTYFSIDYENKIITESVGDGTPNMIYVNNPGTAKYRGIEAQVSFDVGDFLDWSFMLRPYLNLTHLFTYEDEQGATLEYVRDTTLAYGINYSDPSIGFDADLRFTYLGHQREKDWTTGTAANNWQAEQIKTGGDTIVDLFLSKTLYDWEDKGKLIIKGDIKNIFDVNYFTNHGYYMPGRSFYLGLRYEY